MSEDGTAAVLLENVEGLPLREPEFMAFHGGKRQRAWVQNIVAIGRLARVPRAPGVERNSLGAHGDREAVSAVSGAALQCYASTALRRAHR